MYEIMNIRLISKSVLITNPKDLILMLNKKQFPQIIIFSTFSFLAETVTLLVYLLDIKQKKFIAIRFRQIFWFCQIFFYPWVPSILEYEFLIQFGEKN